MRKAGEAVGWVAIPRLPPRPLTRAQAAIRVTTEDHWESSVMED